jgi:hypothetical protein
MSNPILTQTHLPYFSHPEVSCGKLGMHDDFSGITHPIMIKYPVQILCIFHIEEHFTNYSTYFIILPVALLKIILFYFVVTKIHSAKI